MNLTEEERDILNDFITESVEPIEEIEPLLIELEENSSQLEQVDPYRINQIFRVFHSIKGSAGFIGLNLTSTLTHHTETLLDLIRKQKITLTREHIDIFLELCDFFTDLLNHIKEHFSESGYKATADSFAQRLETLIKSPHKKQSKAQNNKKSKKSAETDSKKKKRTEKKKSSQEPSGDTFDPESLITPEMIQQFVQDCEEQIDGLEQDLLELEEQPKNQELIENAFRALHSLKGNAGFFGYSHISSVCHRAESFLDCVRAGEMKANPEQIAILLNTLDFIRSAVENLKKGESADITGISGVMDLMNDFLKDVNTPGEKPSQQQSTVSEGQLETGVQSGPPKYRETSSPTEDHGKGGKTDSDRQPPVAGEGISRTGKNNGSGEVIRVDVNRLNQLMDLVGEIVIAESMVAQHPDIPGWDMPDFEKSILHLHKNIRELQELSTSMRMIPLTGLFRKMLRLVRDLSRKNSKKAELEMTGGDTEVDRSVIEHISDPLVHIIRNSMDHGIETEEERQRNDKPPVGKITLEAKQIGSEIRINVSDDGRGLNREKILAKAREKGIIQNTGDEMTNEQVWNLIFAAGFSTSDKVSDISGRGVGMDVVKRNLEKIRGKVDIESEPGQSTTIILRIPLTTTIIDGMLLRVNQSLYAIPMLDIKESFRVSDSAIINMVGGQEVVKIRDSLLPVIRIHELHKLSSQHELLTEGILVMVENGGKFVCLFADELIGQKQLVIKPMPEYIGEPEGISGCAILGNGDICLIMDVANIIKNNELRGSKQEFFHETK